MRTNSAKGSTVMDDIINTQFHLLGLIVFVFVGAWLVKELSSSLPGPISDLEDRAISSLKAVPAKAVLAFNEESRKVTLNDSPILTVRAGSANYRFLHYMFSNSDQEIHIDKLYREAGISSNVYINKLICNTNIPKDIREKVFSVTDSHVILRTEFLA